jgi:hypothetical protein
LEVLLKISCIRDELVVWNHTLPCVEEWVRDDLTSSCKIWALNWNVTLHALWHRNVAYDRHKLLIWCIYLNFIWFWHMHVNLIWLWDWAMNLDFVWGVNWDINWYIIWDINMHWNLYMTLDDNFTWNRNLDVPWYRDVSDLLDRDGDWDIHRFVNEYFSLDGLHHRDILDYNLSLHLWYFDILNLFDYAFMDLRDLDNFFHGLDNWYFANDFLDFLLEDVLHSFLNLYLWNFNDTLHGLHLGNFDDALLVFNTWDFDHTLLDFDLRHMAHDLLCLDLWNFYDAFLVLDLWNFDYLFLNDLYMAMHDALLDNRFYGDRLNICCGGGKMLDGMDRTSHADVHGVMVRNRSHEVRIDDWDLRGCRPNMIDFGLALAF